MKIDRFNIEKNIKLCASVIFYYRDEIELVPLTLKDLGNPRPCDCPLNTPITLASQCSRCSSKLYQEPFIKERIRHLRINDNAKVMVYMLDILSNLQKRRSDEVIKIIEKTFLEAFSERVFEPVKPAFDLIHFIVFNLVEDYDYVKLTQIFLEFLKKSLKVDMNLTEILMLYLLKDNLILSSEKGHVYDYHNTTSIYKRQICTSGVYSKEKHMLVKYLGLSTCFLAGEPQISEDLTKEIASDLNSAWSGIVSLPEATTICMIHFPLYFSQDRDSIGRKITKHARNSNISADISGLLFNFTMIANNTAIGRKDFEAFLSKSPSFATIKRKFDLSLKEVFGVIYLMKGDTSHEYFDRIISNILRKYKLLPMKKVLDGLLILYASNDRAKIKKTLSGFSKYCPRGEAQFDLLAIIFGHFKGIMVEDNQLRLSFGEFFDMLPSKRSESDPILKDQFLECVHKKNFSRFRAFKENMLYRHKSKSTIGSKNDQSLSDLLDLIELFYLLNFGTDIHEMLAKFRQFVPELEVSTLFTLCVKLLKTINGFKSSNPVAVNERLKESFSCLGEIMIARPHDFEQLWILIYSSDHEAKLKALSEFIETKKLSLGLEDYRFKYHAIYIEKRVKFIRNQLKFVGTFANYSKQKSYQFGIIVIKRLFSKSFRLSTSEIQLLLTTVITKMNPAVKRFSQDPNNSGFDPNESFMKEGKESLGGAQARDKDTGKKMTIESTKTTRFYAALMDFTINQDGTQLGNYFLEEHDEPMLKILTLCRYSNSINDTINRIFEHLTKNGHAKLCALLYFVYMVVGHIKRRKIVLKSRLEQEISDWINIKPEFLEFIELCTERRKSYMVDMIYKIQSRIFYNFYTDKELQKVTNMLESILTKEFYENIDKIISGEQPSLPYMADLFKIPLKKLKFIYVLTNLKQGSKFEYGFDQFANNQDVLKILETRAINAQELVFLLKICLNEIDYDSITDLLRLMKLDQLVVPEVLINLLLLDVKVERKPITIKDFNKRLMVHSAIFDRLEANKEVCWAFCRVLKGDFLIFAELVDILSEDSMPQNHKYFSGILTGMIGIKNHIHFDERADKALISGGIPQYSYLLASHFSRFMRGQKECTLEYAQFLLQNGQHGFNISPFWKVLVDSFSEKFFRRPALKDLDREKIRRLPMFEKVNMIHFVAIYNLVNSDVTVIEFIHDFAYFRNILRFITSAEVAQVINPQLLEEHITFFENKVKDCKAIMKDLIKKGTYKTSFENFDSKQNPIFQGFLADVCNAANRSEVQKTDFYLNFNKNALQAWKQDLLHRKSEGMDNKTNAAIDILITKLNNVFHDVTILIQDPFLLFVTEENTSTKAYWERVFEEVEYLDDYLNSLVDLLMRSLDQVAENFHNESISPASGDFEMADPTSPEEGRHIADDDDDNKTGEQDDEASSTVEDKREKKNQDTGSGPNKTASLDLAVNWFGLPVYIILDRLRKYQSASFDDKSEKSPEILYKSNVLFGILEKALFFQAAGDSFRKFKYFSEFTLSIGFRMHSKSWARFGPSLFMPELAVYFKKLKAENQNLIDGMAEGEDKHRRQEILNVFSKCRVIKLVYENDQDHFPNKGIFAQFTWGDSADDALSSDGKINLAALRPEQMGQIYALRMNPQEESIPFLTSYYTIQELVNPQYKELGSHKRLELLESVIMSRSHSTGMHLDPTQISIKLISKGLYSQMTKEDTDRAMETYNPRFVPNFSGSVEVRSETSQLSSEISRLKRRTLGFLNDIALCKYTVLSETKNIFTEQHELATYQKIYEAILHLHSSKRTFDKRNLLTSLRTLSPYLTSNIHNLHAVLEFVVEPTDSLVQREMQSDMREPDHHMTTGVNLRDYYLFKELGLKNQSFFHIFLLHTYPAEVRPLYIERIIEDLGIIDLGHIKRVMMNLLNLCYLVRSDRETPIGREEFACLAEGILGEKESKFFEDATQSESSRRKKTWGEENKTRDVNLISLIYSLISSHEVYLKNTDTLDKFYQLFRVLSERQGQPLDYDLATVKVLNTFVIDITGKQKKSYLPKFENDSKYVKEVFCLQHPELMNVFDIAHWVTSKHQPSADTIRQKVLLFFESKSFNDKLADKSMMPDSHYSSFLEFLYCLYKRDVEGLLTFFKSENMKEEYVFVLSYYCYVAFLNRTKSTSALTSVKKISKSSTENLALCLCFPMVQQIYSAVLNSDGSRSNERVAMIHDQLVSRIFELPQLDFLHDYNININHHAKTSDAELDEAQHIDRLLKGGMLGDIEPAVNEQINELIGGRSSDPQLRAAIHKLKNLFFFKPEFFQDGSESSAELMKSAFTLRDAWEEASTKITASSTENGLKSIDLLSIFKKELSDKCTFAFMNVDEDSQKSLQDYIFPVMLFVYIYLKAVSQNLDRNDNNAILGVIKLSLVFIWRLFHAKTQDKRSSVSQNFVDPIEALGLQRDSQKKNFLNKYTGLLYNLKTHRSDISILKDLLRFARTYIFMRPQHLPNQSTSNIEDMTEDKEKSVDKLVNSLKLDSFMELYDYLEELESGRDISEHFKENIINLFIQIVSQYERFKKHVPDIRQMVKLVQGDFSQFDYFVDKLYNRSENVSQSLTKASYTKNNMKNYINSWHKVNQLSAAGGEGSRKEDGLAAIPKEDRETLFKRADDGLSTPSDLFLLLRGKPIRSSQISFQEISLIFRRLGLNMTEHRFCEFLSATKLAHSKNAVGDTKISFSNIEESEFDSLFDYLADSVVALAKESLKVSPRNLMNFSLVTFVVYLVSILIASNLMIYFYGGDLIGSIICALIPIVTMVGLARVKKIRDADSETILVEVEKAFQIVTNSKSEVIA